MLICDTKKCDFCGACVAVCPFNAINLYENHFEVLESKCTECGICVKICPTKALKIEK